MRGTQLADLMDTYADMIRAAPAFAGVLVLDGPTVSGDYDSDAIAVGVQPPGETVSPSARVSRTGPGGLMLADFESFALTCAISCRFDTGQGRTARRRACTLYDAAVALIATDPTLGGMVQLAMAGDWALWPLESVQGAEVLLQFDILGRGQL